MLQLKKILVDRIIDILEFEAKATKCFGNESQKHYSQEHRNNETFRLARQAYLIPSLVGGAAQEQSHTSEELQYVKEICGTYDETFLQPLSEPIPTQAQDKIVQILQVFFRKHGFREKLFYFESAIAQKELSLTPRIVFTWLSEWSRKKYVEAISLYQKCKEIPTTTTPKAKPNQSKIRQTKLKPSVHYSSINLESKCKLPAVIPDRCTLYSYLSEEINCYYKTTGIDDLKLYQSKIKRKKGSLNSEDILKTAEFLLMAGCNKDIQLQIKEYEANYMQYKERVGPKLKSDKKIQDQPKVKVELRWRRSTKLTNQDIQCKGQQKSRLRTETLDRGKPPIRLQMIKKSNLLRLDSQYLVTKQQKKQKVEKSSIRLKQLKSKSILRLPAVNNNNNQNESSGSIRMIKLPIENPEAMQNQIEAEQNQDFYQRPVIKAIVIKNFLSNRQHDKKRSRYNENQNKLERLKNNQYNIQGKFSQSIDLNCLRLKSRALLQNFKTIQKY